MGKQQAFPKHTLKVIFPKSFFTRIRAFPLPLYHIPQPILERNGDRFYRLLKKQFRNSHTYKGTEIVSDTFGRVRVKSTRAYHVGLSSRH